MRLGSGKLKCGYLLHMVTDCQMSYVVKEED